MKVPVPELQKTSTKLEEENQDKTAAGGEEEEQETPRIDLAGQLLLSEQAKFMRNESRKSFNLMNQD